VNADVRKCLLEAAKDPDLTVEGGITALLRVAIAHCVDKPEKVSLYELGNVLQGASKGLEAGRGDDSRTILAELQDWMGEDGAGGEE
jgi:hypothetical protein